MGLNIILVHFKTKLVPLIFLELFKFHCSFHSSFWPSADIEPLSNNAVHGMPLYMYAKVFNDLKLPVTLVLFLLLESKARSLH
jgi:hypothetical protein